jgi:hypothetical protein
MYKVFQSHWKLKLVTTSKKGGHRNSNATFKIRSDGQTHI